MAGTMAILCENCEVVVLKPRLAELRPEVRSAEGRSDHKGRLAELRPEVRSAEGRSDHCQCEDFEPAKRRGLSGTRDASSPAMPSPHPDLGLSLSKPHNSLRNKRGLVEAPDLTLERPAPPASHAHVLQVVQPGLLGLMDGSVSTLAPLFATAALTGRTESAFLVGLAASVGAG